MGHQPQAPQFSDARVRKAVREVCALAAGYGKSEAVLLAGVNELLTGDPTLRAVALPQLRSGVEWNVGKNYLRRRKNEDTDAHEYLITTNGLAKEAIE